jgi:hypothetical protein
MIMQPRFHLFITPLHYDRCLEYGLFGVGETQMNQIANVHEGDLAFVYTARKAGGRTRGVIYGPFRILSEPFFSSAEVWAPSLRTPSHDKYPYRVKMRLTEEHVCLNPLPVQILWDLREEGKVKTVIDASALTNKSVINLLPNEGRLILEAILQFNPRPSADPSPYLAHTLAETPIDPLQFTGKTVREFKTEARFETYLLQNPEVLTRLARFAAEPQISWEIELYNQVSTYIAGGAVDIIAIYKRDVFDMLLTLGAAVFELKKGPLDPDSMEQLVQYLEWAGRLLPGLRRNMLHGVLIGRSAGSRTARAELAQRVHTTAAVYSVSCYEYWITGDGRVDFREVAG